jgi:cell division protein FtsQ
MRHLTADPDSGRKPAQRPRPPGARRWLRRGALAGIALALLGAGAFGAHRAGWDAEGVEAVRAKVLALGNAAGLAVNDVRVWGRNRTSADSVLAALDAKRGTPIFAISPADAKARLEALPWVRSASVERLLPDTINVELVERQPLALWQRSGKLELVDREGKVLPVPSLDEFADLIVLVGDDAPKAAMALMDMLASEPALRPRVAAAVRVGGRRWNLRLDTGIEIELPEENTGAAWHELARLDRTDGLLKRDIRRVDLRLPDRLVLQVPEPEKPAPPKKKTAGRTT